jgi:hypothetical protein
MARASLASRGGVRGAAGTIGLAELQYLVETRQVPAVGLGGVTFVSLPGVVAYADRHGAGLGGAPSRVVRGTR